MDLTLLTPDASYESFRDVWTARVELQRALFARHGCTLHPVPWTDAAPERPTLALLSWGYHLQPERWRLLLEGWPAEVPLINAPGLLRWNMDKFYLADLARAGVRTVPTRFAATADHAALTAARTEFGGGELVVKPRISASANHTTRVPEGADAPGLHDAMIQPFLPTVQKEGELSVFFFGGKLGHAVRKVAAEGDFRVQREYGGAFTLVDPSEEELRTASAAIAAAPEPPVYARVDLVAGAEGPMVMEVEMIEPDLYLDFAEDGGDSFARAVLERLRG